MRSRKLSRKSKVIFIFLSVCVALFVLYASSALDLILRPTNDRDNQNPVKQQEMLKIVLDEGDLSPIPKNAVIKTIRTEGNAFTRSFRVIFYC